MFGFQLLAYLFVTVHIVPVRNGPAVVVYAVEYNMYVRMLPVLVAHDDILRIGDFHFTHILLRKLYHLPICQFGRIHCRITQRNMSDRLFQVGFIPVCIQKLWIISPRLSVQNPVRMKQNRLLLAKHIVHTALKPASLFYFSNHLTNGL